jgi:ketosteroid isomerase-like protein
MAATGTFEHDHILTLVLGGWAEAIRVHDPVRVASHFTEDAIFQGADPVRSIGRVGIASYYAKQPPGLTASFTILERRQISADGLLVYADVDFAFPTGALIAMHLSAVLLRTDGSWLIGSYHVSRVAR